MSNQEHELSRWVRNQIFRQREKPLEKFVLRNANAGYRGGEVEEFELPSEQIDPEQVSVMTEQIVQSAQRDADAAGTKLQTYMLMAVEMGSKTGPRHRFRIRGEGEEEDSGEEKPDKEGIISQLMRHNEALMRMATMGASQAITTLTRQLEASQATIAKLNEQKQTAFDTIEDARSKQHERELQLLMAGNEEERKNATFAKVTQKLDMLWPVIVNKLAGKKMLNDSETSILKEFVNGITQEQFINIARHLDESQRVALMAIFKELRN